MIKPSHVLVLEDVIDDMNEGRNIRPAQALAGRIFLGFHLE